MIKKELQNFLFIDFNPIDANEILDIHYICSF